MLYGSLNKESKTLYTSNHLHIRFTLLKSQKPFKTKNLPTASSLSCLGGVVGLSILSNIRNIYIYYIFF